MKTDASSLPGSGLLSGSIKFSIELFLFSMSRSFDILTPYYWVFMFIIDHLIIVILDLSHLTAKIAP